MGTPIDDGGGNRYPSLKLRNVGDYVDAAVAHQIAVGRTEFGSDRPKLKRDGTQQTQDVVTVVVIGGKGVIEEDGVDRPAKPGEIAVIFIASRDRWDSDGDKARAKGAAKSWSGAKKDLGGLATGDVLRWKFEAEVPGQGDRDRKIRTFLLRRPRPDEADLERRCDDLHAELIGQGRTQLETVPASAAAYDDEEPF